MASRTVSAAVALVGAAGLSLAAAVPAQAATPCVQKVSVINNGGFVIDFQVTTRTGELSASTDDYPINQYRVVDLNSTPFAEGSDVRPLVHAQAGNTVPGNVFVSFCNNGQTATYTASGTTLNYTVTLLT
ncbi:hypothetical protein ACWT_2755 [Actinoplanes sp. SE50]|uniref:hypothetical protein n=1 Tax=unclassified Actinoplanes TaxID=2626549 RepID=UPI00023EC79C|nr:MULTISPECIES: hypothetical protein [unclassified Actinoplanes]AEV83686.1 hypothetical protein ACPL_2791 [Actinoplanes sp. SE50/110]ATO82170.1 hypothetical protein ACWT_2755 [Actinoplanes sp. SE50]SLL99577.1 extracellular protein [Actinoplanes sp. SE50/110]